MNDVVETLEKLELIRNSLKGISATLDIMYEAMGNTELCPDTYMNTVYLLFKESEQSEEEITGIIKCLSQG